MTDRADPEAALVALAQGGSDAAFEELVRRYQRTIRHLLWRLSGDVTLGDDLAQETFLHAWRSLRRLRAPGAFAGWLRQIAVNTWLQHARRAKLPMDALADDEIALVAQSLDPVPKVDLDAALARLRPSERTCLVLAYAEGMSHREIAETTGLPLGTVKSHVARSAAKLRQRLKARTATE